MERGAKWLGRYSLVLYVVLICIAICTLLRIALLAWNLTEIDLTISEYTKLFGVGLSFDLFVSLIAALPIGWHMAVYRDRFVESPYGRRLLWGFLGAQFCAILFVCIAEWLFFDEFSSRFNYLAFEYIVYPHEVMTNIWESFPVVPLVLTVMTLGCGLTWMLVRRVGHLNEIRLPVRRRWLFFSAHITCIVALLPFIRFNNIDVSQNRVANEIAGNGWYSFGYYAWTCRYDYQHFYTTLPAEDAIAEVREMLAGPTVTFLEPDSMQAKSPLDRIVHSETPQRDWNVVLIFEESFGSDFVGALGDDQGLSPSFDALTKDGLLFDNFYATGNRTARALEAVLASFPPIPTEAILKRDHSSHIYTLAHALGERGYRRTFVSGGRGIFDGVRPFMIANGFENFVEQKDYDQPVFVNAWGVSDEDTLNRAVIECDKLHDSGSPFFVSVLTVSNHRPFTYPEGRIDLPPSQQKREHAVKYADWALGEFFRQARQRPFFKNTLFVVLGDHGARVYGSQLFPMNSYRVPLVMIRPDGAGAGQRHSTLGCSMDVATTILGVLGGDYRTVFYGQDMLRVPPHLGRAIMQHNHDLAWLTADDQLFVLGLKRSRELFSLQKPSFELRMLATPQNAPTMKSLISLFQVADRMYYEERQFPGD